MSWTTCSPVIKRTLAHVQMAFPIYPRSVDVTRGLFTFKLPLLFNSSKILPLQYASVEGLSGCAVTYN